VDLPSRRPLQRFAVRFGILFILTLLPLPGLQSFYTALFRLAANAVLSLSSDAAPVAFRFEPLPSPSASASAGRNDGWTLDLHVLNPGASRDTVVPFNVRASSYRPIATFLALAFAALITGWRSRARLVGIGMIAMIVITAGLTVAQAIYDGLGQDLGFTPGPVVTTICQALTSPAMSLYAIPILVFWASCSVTERFGGAASAVADPSVSARPRRLKRKRTARHR
jgi:hypothetical protein